MKKAGMRVICRDDACLTTMRLHSMSLPCLFLASSTSPDLPPAPSRTCALATLGQPPGIFPKHTAEKTTRHQRQRRGASEDDSRNASDGEGVEEDDSDAATGVLQGGQMALRAGRKKKTWQPEEDVEKKKTARGGSYR